MVRAATYGAWTANWTTDEVLGDDGRGSTMKHGCCGLVFAAAAVVSVSCAGTSHPVQGPASDGNVRITVLTTAGCGQTEPAIERVKAVAARLGIGLSIDRVLVATPEDAKRLHFLGSPTILVNDRDLDSSARERTDFGFR